MTTTTSTSQMRAINEIVEYAQNLISQRPDNQFDNTQADFMWVWKGLVGRTKDDIKRSLKSLNQMQDEGRNSEALLTIMICQACDWIENTYDSHNFARNNHNAIAVAKDDQGATEILALIDTLQIIDEHLKARICKLKLKSNMILPISNVQALNIGLNSFDPLLPKPVNDPNVTFDVKEYKKIGESIHSNTIHRNGYEFNTSVWRVRNRKSGVEFAMKIYTCKDQALISSYHNEAQIMATLSGKHPCFLDYHGYAMSHTDYGYKMHILMELCSGTLMDTISQKAVDGSRFSIEDINFWFRLLLDGYLYLEKLKIYHQDVKPHNIFISKYGMLKIADFNVSHVMDDFEKTYTPTGVHPIQGTSGYMAPELQIVMDAKSRDPNYSGHLKYKRGKADCYSLGLIFLQMLTLAKLDGINMHDQITIDNKLSEIRPSWIKNMLSSMLKVDYRKRATFKRAMAFIPYENNS